MVQTLYGNAAPLATILGGGAHGHIGIIMTPPLYAILLTNIPYEPPMDPGALPNIPPAANKAVRELTCMEHHEEQRIFDNHHDLDDALKAQVIDTIQDTYICEMRNKYHTGYLGVTTQDLMDHLLDQYSKITPADIGECKCPINSTQAVDVFFSMN
jgi:hypothetical protein